MNVLNLNIIYNCRKATRLVVKSACVKISITERIKMQFHLLICKYCRLFKKQNQLINELLDKDEKDDKWIQRLEESFPDNTTL